MLRRAENVDAEIYKKGFFFKKYYYKLWVSKTVSYQFETTAEDWNQMLAQSDDFPVCYGQVGERIYWHFEGNWYWENEQLSQDEIHALLYSRKKNRQNQINRAKELVTVGERPRTGQRRGIPDNLKLLVWERDGGQCVNCGSTESLQFDHIIPVAMGGATTAENLQLLCAACNMKKGGHLV